MKKVKSKLSTFMQNFVAMGLLMLLTLLLCFTTSPFEKSQPKTIDAVSIIPDSTAMYEWNQDERGWYTYLGSYPQTYVGDELNAQLVSLLESGDLDDYATGNTYISNNLASALTSYEEKQNKEYEYDGKLYVAVENQQHSVDINGVDNPYFSTGDSLGEVGDTKFFKVEPIKWYIIDGTNSQTAPAGTQCRVIGDLVLNAMPFNATKEDGNVWQDSLIRQYLNGNFYQSTGLANEAVVIQQHNENNVTGDKTDRDGPATNDYVYLLSYQEMNGQFEFLDTNAERMTKPTDFALSNGAIYKEDAAEYWLRSAGSIVNSSYVVAIGGGLTVSSIVHDTRDGVRPALTLDLDVFSNKIYISTADELKQLSDYSAAGGIFNPNWKFYLENDIDMSDVQNFAIGSIDNPFTGYFNGQGHTISNINFNTSLGVVGMFMCAQDCTIINLNLEYGEIVENAAAYFGGLIMQCQDNVLISNVDVSIESLEPATIYCGGLIAMLDFSHETIPIVTITDCNVNFGNVVTPMIFGGIIGIVDYGGDAVVTISRCMVMIGSVDIVGEVEESYCSGIVGGLVYDKSSASRYLMLNQIYVDLGVVNAAPNACVAGLLACTSRSILITYNEIMVSANINCSDPSKVIAGYEWVVPPSENDMAYVFGTNSYFNFTGNVAADFGGLGKYAGVFDVARKQYYSGFSDNQWLIFSTDKHPTLREFMAVGDFATVQSVEDKLIELGYTKIM